MIKNFLGAVRFLTILPLPGGEGCEDNRPGMMVYFPLVGALLGGGLAFLAGGLTNWFEDGFGVSVVVVVALAALTGGLHLDGVADTFDGLLSWKDREGMLSVMRDPRVGVMGVLSLVSVLMLKAAFLSFVGEPNKGAALVIMCVTGRWSLVGLMHAFPYARAEGKAKAFMAGKGLKTIVGTSLAALAIVVVPWGARGACAALLAVAGAFGFGAYVNRKLGGITGDALGAACELSEVMVLMSLCVLERAVL